jgi:hypothetical protein
MDPETLKAFGEVGITLVDQGLTPKARKVLRPTTDSVNDISDDELLRRAVRSARPKYKASPRWAAVMDTFGLGSTYARQLCHRFGLDPNETFAAKRPRSKVS